MRSLFRRAIVAGSCLVLWAGCSAKQQTEYVTGISTQVTVPRDLKAVVIEISVGGSVQFCAPYKVYDGVVQLPRSLGTFAQNTPNAAGPIQYTILGMSEEYTPDSANPVYTSCTGLAVGTNNARLLRRSRQPYIVDEIRFLPMPLKFACIDKACGTEETCKGGKCVSATVADPEKAFPRYTPEMSDGTGGTCFHVSTFKGPDGTTDIPGCMTAALPALTVDAGKCIYAVPNTPDAPAPAGGQASPFSGPSSGLGVNVQVTYDGLVKEILDSDPDEGFSIPDPMKPQQFKLSDGLCDMVKGTNGALHQITDIRTSGTCQGKQLAQPLCAADQNAAMGLDPTGHTPNPAPDPICENIQLKPPPSALMLVIDDSTSGASFFKALIGGTNVVDQEDDIVGPAVTAAFKTQAFSQTTIGAFYTTAGATSTTCSTTGEPDAAFGVGLLSTDTVDARFDVIRSHAPSAIADSDIYGGLSRAYNELAKPVYNDDLARSVIVFSNHFDDSASCNGNASSAALAASKLALPQSVKTYAMQIVKSPVLDITDGNTSAAKLAAAGGSVSASYKVVDAGGAGAKFKDILHDLATCDYAIPNASLAHPVDGSEKLVWTDVATGIAVTPPAFNAACTDRAADVDGWGYSAGPNDTTRIHLCRQTCTDYRAKLDAALLLGSLYAQPAPSVPIYFRRGTCE